MELYRISLTKYCEDISGYGAQINGGRWNEIGIPALYTSQTRALTVLEILANMNSIPNGVSYSLVTLELPDESTLETIHLPDLPDNWKQRVYVNKTVASGSRWLENHRTLLLQVPSSLVFEEYNMIINPLHPDFKSVKIKKIRTFEFDRRLADYN